MFCNNCGKQNPDGAKFCSECGAPIAGVIRTNPQQPPRGVRTVQPPVKGNVKPNYYPPQRPINQPPQKPRKPWYTRWWIWLLITLGTLQLLGLFSIYINSGNDKSKYQKSTQSSVATTENSKGNKPSEQATEKQTEAPTKEVTVSEKDFKQSCKSIDFETLSRNPDKYKGNNYVFTGEVIQVSESSWLSDTVSLRVNVTKNEYEHIDADPYYTDTIYAEVEIPDGADRILENDIITFWGTCEGMYSYTSVLGSKISLPKISINYYQLDK